MYPFQGKHRSGNDITPMHRGSRHGDDQDAEITHSTLEYYVANKNEVRPYLCRRLPP